VGPPDPLMPPTEMTIRYTRAEEHAVGEELASTLIDRYSVVRLPSPGTTVSVFVWPDQPSATSGTSTSLPAPRSLDNRVREVRSDPFLLRGARTPGKIDRVLSCQPAVESASPREMHGSPISARWETKHIGLLTHDIRVLFVSL
jgi:hypothetical protein